MSLYTQSATMPPVTVLMPVYNAERYLRSAVASILRQTYQDFEFLIINDGSTDSSADILAGFKDPRIRLVENERNLGLTRTLNRGLALAEGGLIARQDADDLSHPERLARQVAFMHAHPQAALVGAQGWIIDGSGCPTGGRVFDKACAPEGIRWEMLFDNSFNHSAVVFRAGIVRDQFKGYDESIRYCQDYELWSRVAVAHPVHNLPERLVWWRVHTSSMTNTMQGVAFTERQRIIRGSMDRLFGAGRLPDKEIELLVRYVYTREFDSVSLNEFLTLFGRVKRYYEERVPGATGLADYRRAVARRYADLLYRTARVHFSLGVGVLAGAPRLVHLPAFFLCLVREVFHRTAAAFQVFTPWRMQEG